MLLFKNWGGGKICLFFDKKTSNPRATSAGSEFSTLAFHKTALLIFQHFPPESLSPGISPGCLGEYQGLEQCDIISLWMYYIR